MVMKCAVLPSGSRGNKWVAWWRNGRALDLRSRGRGFDSRVGAQLRNDRGQVAHTRLPSASEVTTIWRYTNLYIIIIIIIKLIT